MENSNKSVTKKRKFLALKSVRLAIQIAFFIFLPGLYVDAFLDIKTIFSAVVGGSFDLGTLLPQIIGLIAVIPVTVFLGRFFCGWACAFGSFGDFLYKIVGKIFKKRLRMNETADRMLKLVKYGILAYIVIFLWTFDAPGLSAASPWDVFGMLATVGSVPDISYVAANLTMGLLFFILIAVGSIFVQRFFCRYLCPLGAVFTLFSAFKATRIEKPARNCGRCRICTDACAMGIPLYRKDSVHSGECIECQQCIAACPRGNVKCTLAGNDIRPLVAGTMAAIVIAGVYGTVGNAFAGSNDNSTQISESSGSLDQDVIALAGLEASTGENSVDVSQENASSSPEAAPSASPSVQVTAGDSTSQSQYADGTYTGTGTGFRGAQTEVSVTIANGLITDIVTVSYGDDRPYYSRAFSDVSQEIISSQSTDVDAVSGATYSSDGIMEAVQSALSEAAVA